jgi:hypothetical protein
VDEAAAAAEEWCIPDDFFFASLSLANAGAAASATMARAATAIVIMGLFIWLFIDNLLRNERCIVLGLPIQQGTCRILVE